MIARIQIRRDTTANWASFNPVLSDGEFGVETLTNGDKKIKIGDGVKNWNGLDYFSASDVTYSQFMNHINNTADAHGVDSIKNSIAAGLNGANAKIDNHISNTTNAHGVDVMKTDINELETNFANVYRNLTLHINNNTSAHGINNIKDKIDSVESDLNGKINAANGDLRNHTDNSVDAHGVDVIKSNLTATNTNLTNHANNNENAHGIDEIKTDLNTTNGNLTITSNNLSDHIGNADAHGIDVLKSEVNDKISGVESELNDKISDVESELNDKIDVIEIDLTTANANLNNHIDNDIDAHGIDGIKVDLNNHIGNDADAHGIDGIKSDVENISVEITGLREAIENIDIVSIKGSVDTFVDLPDPSNLLDGTAYIVEEDENFNGVTTIYAVVNGSWEFIGRFNIDLSNYYTKDEVDYLLDKKADKANTYTKTEVNDLIQANIVNPSLVNSPHLWAVGTEYSFGDGTYGRRYTGTTTGNAATRVDNALTPNPAINRIIQSGGEWSYDNYNYMTLYTAIPGYSSGLYRGNLIFSTLSSSARSNAPFDIWIRYTK